MRDINFKCPHCGNKLVVDAAAAGLSVPCPVCSKPIVVATEAGLQTAAVPSPSKLKARRKVPTAMLAGMAAIVALIGTFFLWHAGLLSKRMESLQGASSIPSHSTSAEMAVKSEAEQRLVSQANLGEPQAVLGLLDQNPGLEKSLGLLAETPLRWALAQRPANARRMLSEAVTQIPPMLRATEAPPDSVWLECLESQPEESGSVRPADKMFPNHPEVLDGIKYLRGFRSHDRDSSYNVFINGKAKRLSALVGLVDSNRTNGHLRFLIMVDGRCAGDSGFMVGGQKPKLLVVDLTGVQKLSVRVDTGGNGTWANPAIAGALLELTPDEYMHSAAVSGKVEELSQLLNGNRKRVRAVDGLFGLPPFGVACTEGQTDAALVIARQGGEVRSAERRVR